ncbi:GTP pyrophosphokinase [Corynebacterium pelargi]|uniref:GTP pyrophosphokinase YwaC n=1 Tax=Corynebacterium pelargi TaxID=1471400 RepID=A0A410W7Y5_9CORY|nr:GTP pyrophosphokinase family protein [Corynebacterium pelargi]QAU52065.1 GTP pyrophosphokinase YwaC [Corynebacterium pelargi]GGG70389.1 GTP pyrophosphokinase [Corynebacterium pelargi]
MGSKRITQLSQKLRAFNQEHPQAAEDFVDAFEDVLADAGLTYDRVAARVKKWSSLKAKANKKADGKWIYPDPWQDVHDIIGVRITTLHSTEIPHVIDAIDDVFSVVRSVDKTAQTRISGGFGYGSHHLILKVDERVESLREYLGQQFEVQIRTVLQHAWAEFEHDIRYKRATDLDPQIDRAFTLTAGLIELADQQFDQIAAIREPDTTSSKDVAFSAETLPGIIAMILGNTVPPSRSEHYQWLEELLHAHDITTASQLRQLLSPQRIALVRDGLDYRFQPGQIRLIDDLLLLSFGETHIEKTGSSGAHPKQRIPRLRRRLEALHKARQADPTVLFEQEP